MHNLDRARQAWIIARIELRRAFVSRRAFWVYGLALLPSLIFLGGSLQARLRESRLSAGGLTPAPLVDGLREGQAPAEVLERLGRPVYDRQWVTSRRVRDASERDGVTRHPIEPAVEARYVRLNILQPAYGSDRTARIYEFEVYGDGPENLALGRPATSSPPCSAGEGPEKAFNGSVAGGPADRWCSRGGRPYLQVDLGAAREVRHVVIRHAGAGGEPEELNTRLFSVKTSADNRLFTTVVEGTGARLVDEITAHRALTYFDGRREARLEFADGALASTDIRPLRDFEGDRTIFAGVFQYFYLRLAVFFGCLGIFMNLFRGEMLDRTLHCWLLAPARRGVLLAGKYGAGLIASTVIFAGGALLCLLVLLWTHDPAEVEAYWRGSGMAHAFWYALAAALGCVGYGSVFLAAGLLVRNPILPAAVLLGWEAIHPFLPRVLQKLSVLHYLQSLCPVPAPPGRDLPALLQLLLAPAEPASRAGSILGLLLLTALVLGIARRAIGRLEISYGTES